MARPSCGVSRRAAIIRNAAPGASSGRPAARYSSRARFGGRRALVVVFDRARGVAYRSYYSSACSPTGRSAGMLSIARW